MQKKIDKIRNSDGIFLGLDFGTKNIGIASGQKITGTATPLNAITAKDGVPNWQDLDKIINAWQPVAIVVGVPIKLDGTEHWVTQAARKFILSLRQRYKIPIYSANEQLTTKSAKEKIFAIGSYKALQKEDIDSLAAKIILEGWLKEK